MNLKTKSNIYLTLKLSLGGILQQHPTHIFTPTQQNVEGRTCFDNLEAKQKHEHSLKERDMLAGGVNMLNCVSEERAENRNTSANGPVKFHYVKEFGPLQLEPHNNALSHVPYQYYHNTTQLFTLVC